jgi:hypothetical protein
MNTQHAVEYLLLQGTEFDAATRARTHQAHGQVERQPPFFPGVHRAALESGARIGRRQVHRLDVSIRIPRLFQRFRLQVMDVGALVQRDLLALQVGQRGMCDWQRG